MLKRNIIANFLGKIWPSLLGLLLVPVYLKYLGVEAYGLIGFFVSLQGLMAFLDMGLSTASVREIARDSVTEADKIRQLDLVYTFQSVYWGVAILLASVFFFASRWLAYEWITSDGIPVEVIRLAAIVFGITLALRWPVALYTGVMRGLEKQVLVNLVSSASVTLRNVGATLMIVFVSQSVLAFLLWQLGAALVEVSVMAYLAWRMLPRQEGHKSAFRLSIIKQVGKFSASLTIVSILASIFKQFDRIAITKILSLEFVGYYVAAYTIYELLSYFVAPVADAAFPRFSSLLSQNNKAELVKIYHGSAQTISFFIAPVSAFVVLFSWDILFLWSRSNEIAQNAHTTLSVLALAYSFNAMMHIPLMLQYAAGITFISMAVNIFGFVFLLPLMYFIISHFGLAGAGITWLIFNVLYYLVVPHIMHSQVLPGEKVKWIFKDTLAFMFLAWLLIGGTYLVVNLLGNRLLTFGMVCVAGMVYITICRSLYETIRSLIKLSAFKVSLTARN